MNTFYLPRLKLHQNLTKLVYKFGCIDVYSSLHVWLFDTLHAVIMELLRVHLLLRPL